MVFGMVITLERFATAVREISRRIIAEPKLDGAPLREPVRGAFLLGVETLRADLLALADVGEFDDLPDLDERARSFCFNHCPNSRGTPPGEAEGCDGCPLRFATVERLVDAAREAAEEAVEQ